jgi:hypothetical protein
MVQRSRHAGQGYTPELQAKLEGALGADLGSVDVRSNSAAQLAMQGALATAEGDEVHLPANADPHLIAHEFAHTVQPRSADPTTPGDPNERQAERFANAFVSDDTATMGQIAAATSDRPRTGTGLAMTPSNASEVGSADQFIDAETRAPGADSDIRYTYTDRGGWVDREHMAAHAGISNEVMAQLERRAPQVSVTDTNEGIGGTFVTLYQVDYSRVPAGEGARETLAVALIGHHDIAFEMFQGTLNAANGQHYSVFDMEDLPSDRIGTQIGLVARRMWAAGVPASAGQEAIPGRGAAVPPTDMDHPSMRPYYTAAMRQVMGELGGHADRSSVTDQYTRDGGASGTSGGPANRLRHTGLMDTQNQTSQPLGVTNPARFLAGGYSPPWLNDAVTVQRTLHCYHSANALEVFGGPLVTAPTRDTVGRVVPGLGTS